MSHPLFQFSYVVTFAAKEQIIGWYHTGPKLRPGDVNINEVLRRFVPDPVRSLAVLSPNYVTGANNAMLKLDTCPPSNLQKLCDITCPCDQMGADRTRFVHLSRDNGEHAAGTPMCTDNCG
jgi:26S proteasome regulatory subunit N8